MSLYPAPQVAHGCLWEEPLESVPEFVKFVFTVHSDTYTIWVTVTLVRLASAARRLENDSTQKILSWYACALRIRKQLATKYSLGRFRKLPDADANENVSKQDVYWAERTGIDETPWWHYNRNKRLLYSNILVLFLWILKDYEKPLPKARTRFWRWDSE